MIKNNFFEPRQFSTSLERGLDRNRSNFLPIIEIKNKYSVNGVQSYEVVYSDYNTGFLDINNMTLEPHQKLIAEYETQLYLKKRKAEFVPPAREHYGLSQVPSNKKPNLAEEAEQITKKIKPNSSETILREENPHKNRIDDKILPATKDLARIVQENIIKDPIPNKVPQIITESLQIPERNLSSKILHEENKNEERKDSQNSNSELAYIGSLTGLKDSASGKKAVLDSNYTNMKLEEGEGGKNSLIKVKIEQNSQIEPPSKEFKISKIDLTNDYQSQELPENVSSNRYSSPSTNLDVRNPNLPSNPILNNAPIVSSIKPEESNKSVEKSLNVLKSNISLPQNQANSVSPLQIPQSTQIKAPNNPLQTGQFIKTEIMIRENTSSNANNYLNSERFSVYDGEIEFESSIKINLNGVEIPNKAKALAILSSIKDPIKLDNPKKGLCFKEVSNKQYKKLIENKDKRVDGYITMQKKDYEKITHILIKNETKVFQFKQEKLDIYIKNLEPFSLHTNIILEIFFIEKTEPAPNEDGKRLLAHCEEILKRNLEKANIEKNNIQPVRNTVKVATISKYTTDNTSSAPSGHTSVAKITSNLTSSRPTEEAMIPSPFSQTRFTSENSPELGKVNQSLLKTSKDQIDPPKISIGQAQQQQQQIPKVQSNQHQKETEQKDKPSNNSSIPNLSSGSAPLNQTKINDIKKGLASMAIETRLEVENLTNSNPKSPQNQTIKPISTDKLNPNPQPLLSTINKFLSDSQNPKPLSNNANKSVNDAQNKGAQSDATKPQTSIQNMPRAAQNNLFMQNIHEEISKLQTYPQTTNKNLEINPLQTVQEEIKSPKISNKPIQKNSDVQSSQAEIKKSQITLNSAQSEEINHQQQTMSSSKKDNFDSKSPVKKTKSQEKESPNTLKNYFKSVEPSKSSTHNSQSLSNSNSISREQLPSQSSQDHSNKITEHQFTSKSQGEKAVPSTETYRAYISSPLLPEKNLTSSNPTEKNLSSSNPTSVSQNQPQKPRTSFENISSSLSSNIKDISSANPQPAKKSIINPNSATKTAIKSAGNQDVKLLQTSRDVEIRRPAELQSNRNASSLSKNSDEDQPKIILNESNKAQKPTDQIQRPADNTQFPIAQIQGPQIQKDNSSKPSLTTQMDIEGNISKSLTSSLHPMKSQSDPPSVKTSYFATKNIEISKRQQSDPPSTIPEKLQKNNPEIQKNRTSSIEPQFPEYIVQDDFRLKVNDKRPETFTNLTTQPKSPNTSGNFAFDQTNKSKDQDLKSNLNNIPASKESKPPGSTTATKPVSTNTSDITRILSDLNVETSSVTQKNPEAKPNIIDPRLNKKHFEEKPETKIKENPLILNPLDRREQEKPSVEPKNIENSSKPRFDVYSSLKNNFANIQPDQQSKNFSGVKELKSNNLSSNQSPSSLSVEKNTSHKPAIIPISEKTQEHIKSPPPSINASEKSIPIDQYTSKPQQSSIIPNQKASEIKSLILPNASATNTTEVNMQSHSNQAPANQNAITKSKSTEGGYINEKYKYIETPNPDDPNFQYNPKPYEISTQPAGKEDKPKISNSSPGIASNNSNFQASSLDISKRVSESKSTEGTSASNEIIVRSSSLSKRYDPQVSGYGENYMPGLDSSNYSTEMEYLEKFDDSGELGKDKIKSIEFFGWKGNFKSYEDMLFKIEWENRGSVPKRYTIYTLSYLRDKNCKEACECLVNLFPEFCNKFGNMKEM